MDKKILHLIWGLTVGIFFNPALLAGDDSDGGGDGSTPPAIDPQALQKLKEKDKKLEARLKKLEGRLKKGEQKIKQDEQNLKNAKQNLNNRLTKDEANITALQQASPNSSTTSTTATD